LVLGFHHLDHARGWVSIRRARDAALHLLRALVEAHEGVGYCVCGGGDCGHVRHTARAQLSFRSETK
jgi:hypothetical protein